MADTRAWACQPLGSIRRLDDAIAAVLQYLTQILACLAKVKGYTAEGRASFLAETWWELSGLKCAWNMPKSGEMKVVIADHSPVAIWKRAIQPERAGFTPAEARATLRLRLSSPDLGRADELAAKARAGGLASEEEREMDDYVAIGSALEFLKSKARLSLKRARAAA